MSNSGDDQRMCNITSISKNITESREEFGAFFGFLLFSVIIQSLESQSNELNEN